VGFSAFNESCKNGGVVTWEVEPIECNSGIAERLISAFAVQQSKEE